MPALLDYLRSCPLKEPSFRLGELLVGPHRWKKKVSIISGGAFLKVHLCTP